MEYRKLGKYGMKVSEIALGSWLTFGSDECIKKAYENGVNYFDTADEYGIDLTYPGAAEEFLAKALEDYPRTSYILATKAYFPVGTGPNDRGASRKHLIESCNNSLKRLKTDYVDIFYCHRYDTETPLEETMMALDDLVRQGKVLYTGISEWSAVNIADGVGMTKRMGFHPITVNQPMYNMFNRYIEKDVMNICAREGIGIAVYSPNAEGVLTGKYKKGEKPPEGSRLADNKKNMWIKRFLTDENYDRLEKLKVIAGDLGLTMSQLSLAWILQHKEITSVIIGANKPAQLEENLKASGVRLSGDTMEAIDKIIGYQEILP